MEHKHIEYYMKVVEEKSINKAAQALFMTSQGLSRIIASLEEELNTELLIRSHKGVEASKSGLYFYEKGKILLNEIIEMKIQIAQIDASEQFLTVAYACGVLHTVSFDYLYKLLKNDGQQIQWLEMKNEDVREKIMNGQIDVGFIIGHTHKDGFIERPFVNRELGVLVYEGHPFYDLDVIHLESLKNESLVTLNEQFHCYSKFMQAANEANFVPHILAKTMESRLLAKLCSQHVGLGIDVHFDVFEYQHLHLKMIPFAEKIEWPVSILYKKDHVHCEIIEKIFNQLF